MKKLFKKEFVIGLSVLIALTILFFGIDYLKGINLFKPANFYYANYDNVAGLEIAAPVSIDGYKVGQVRDIEFNYDNPGKIKVLLALDPKLRLPKGTQARIEQSLLSGAFITLQLGSDRSSMIPVGGELTPSSAPDMMAAINEQIMPQVNSILPRVDSLMMSLNALASHPALYASIGRMDGITRNLYTSTASLNNTLGALNRSTPAILNTVGNVAYNLDTITGDLTVFSAQMKNLPIDESLQNINQLTTNLIAFSEQLNNQKSSLGLLMNDPELYNRVCRVAADVDSLIIDIKRNPKRYISIKLL